MSRDKKAQLVLRALKLGRLDLAQAKKPGDGVERAMQLELAGKVDIGKRSDADSQAPKHAEPIRVVCPPLVLTVLMAIVLNAGFMPF